MHTHFASGPHFVTTGLNVLIFLTLWRLVWHHVAANSKGSTVNALASAALYQAG